MDEDDLFFTCYKFSLASNRQVFTSSFLLSYKLNLKNKFGLLFSNKGYNDINNIINDFILFLFILNDLFLVIYFVRFYFNVPNFVHPNPKVADNPKTLIKVNIHISGSVKTYKTSGQDMTRPSGGLKRCPK